MICRKSHSGQLITGIPRESPFKAMPSKRSRAPDQAMACMSGEGPLVQASLRDGVWNGFLRDTASQAQFSPLPVSGTSAHTACTAHISIHCLPQPQVSPQLGQKSTRGDFCGWSWLSAAHGLLHSPLSLAPLHLPS